MLFLQVILPVFAIILAGFILEKTTRLDFRTLTYTSLYLFSPALVFSALTRQEVRLDLGVKLSLFMLLYTALLLALSLAAGRLLRMDRDAGRALSLSTVMMNVGNFGLPLAFFAFGQPGLDVSVLTFVLFNIPLSTLAIVLAQGSGTSFLSALGNTLKIPIFHAVALAFVLKLAQLPVPGFVLRPVTLLGEAAIPVMLVLLGMQLARTRIQASVLFLSLATLIRLGVAPAVGWTLATLLGLEGLTRNVVVLQTSTPAAVLPLLYSLRFGTRPDLVASAILVTTLASGFSLTVLLYLMQ